MRDLTTCEQTGTEIESKVGTYGTIVGAYDGGFVIQEQPTGKILRLPFDNIQPYGWKVTKEAKTDSFA